MWFALTNLLGARNTKSQNDPCRQTRSVFSPEIRDELLVEKQSSMNWNSPKMLSDPPDGRARIELVSFKNATGKKLA